MYIEKFTDELIWRLDGLQNNPQCWDSGWGLGRTEAGLGLTLWKLGHGNQSAVVGAGGWGGRELLINRHKVSLKVKNSRNLCNAVLTANDSVLCTSKLVKRVEHMFSVRPLIKKNQ